MNNKCPICENDCEKNSFLNPTRHDGPDFFRISCKVCGEYNITRNASLTLVPLKQLNPNEQRQRLILSSAVRNIFERGEEVYISEENIDNILDSVFMPSDPFESIDLLLKYLFLKAGKPPDSVTLNPKYDYPILFAETPNEFQFYLAKARELKLIELASEQADYRLSIEGWRRIAELRKTEKKSNKAFVAMWFDSSLDQAWRKGFKEALKETGFRPIRIDLTEHNEKICDRILAEIRQSGLVVTDFTGQRGGVYFEAGFALGLGITVIWTCRDTDIKDLHFDTRQYNHIVWSNPEELKNKLINRIEATLPNRPRK